MQNTKAIGLPMILMLGLLISGLAYANWEKTITISGSVGSATLVPPCAKFVPPVTRTDHDNDWTSDENLENVRQLYKDIGWSEGKIVADNKVEIKLHNVYPSYYEHIAIWVKNCGTTPWVIQRVIFNPGGIVMENTGHLRLDLDSDLDNDVEIYWGDSFGLPIGGGGLVNLSFGIHVLQDAPQGQTLGFTVEIGIVKSDEYVPPGT